jgi:translation initiation factor eIF-2B subunit gamma
MMNDMLIHFLWFVSDTILVVVEHVRSEVQTALEACGLKIRLDIVSIPAEEDWGTADTLRFLSDRIKVCLSL